MSDWTDSSIFWTVIFNLYPLAVTFEIKSMNFATSQRKWEVGGCGSVGGCGCGGGDGHLCYWVLDAI